MTIYQQINETKNAAGLPVFSSPAAYSLYLETEAEKYDCIHLARQAGATVTGVSACGSGYYLQIQATPDQADHINRNLYTAEIDRMTAAQAWAAWTGQRLTVGQLATWQERLKTYFDASGNVIQDGGRAE
jgi:hypothetical protein